MGAIPGPAANRVLELVAPGSVSDLGFLRLWALRRFDTELARLSQRNEEFSRRLATVEQRSQAAAQERRHRQHKVPGGGARDPEKPGGRCSGQI